MKKYFYEGIPVEDTIKKHLDIYDFCGRQKFNKDSDGIVNYVRNFNIEIKKQQKTTRYYISNKGGCFIKKYKKTKVDKNGNITQSQEFINKGYLVTIFNKYIEKPFEKYDINYDFYIKECHKEIKQLENKTKQLVLL